MLIVEITSIKTDQTFLKTSNFALYEIEFSTHRIKGFIKGTISIKSLGFKQTARADSFY